MNTTMLTLRYGSFLLRGKFTIHYVKGLEFWVLKCNFSNIVISEK